MAQTSADLIETGIRGEQVDIVNTFINTGVNFSTTLFGNFIGGKLVPTNRGWFQTKYFKSVFTRPYGQKLIYQTVVGSGVSILVNFLRSLEYDFCSPPTPISIE